MDYGWLPPSNRSSENKKSHDDAVTAMPKFATQSKPGAKLFLFDFSRKIRNGKDFPCFFQKTGSCVGNGATIAIWYLMAMEAVQLGEMEKVTLPFLPYIYGRGRFHSGMRGQGEGSLGSGQAKAVRLDGVIEQSSTLPTPIEKEDSLTWGASVEMEWSAGEKIPSTLIETGKKHPVKTTALVTSYEEVRDALANGYPVTVASNRGFRGEDASGYGIPGGVWNHQMCFIGVDDSGNRPYCVCQNSWGASQHNQSPEFPKGSFKVDAKVVDYMVKQEDSFAYSQFDGFPVRIDLSSWR